MGHFHIVSDDPNSQCIAEDLNAPPSEDVIYEKNETSMGKKKI